MHRKFYIILFLLLASSPLRQVLTADVSTSVIVPPSPSNYSLSIAASPIQSTYPPNSVINYTVTYGNNFNLVLPLKIVASWTKGTISGNPSPSVDIADYVIGSASQAYGGAMPIIDTENQTITWQINSFPGNTSGQTVNFQLETNSNYTGPLQVSFTTSAYLTTTGMTTPSQGVTSYYQYQASPTPTPSPVPTPSPTPGPTGTPNPNSSPTPIPSPTPTSPALTIQSVNISSTSENSAVISVTTSNPSSIVLSYGINPSNLSKTVSSNSLNYLSFLSLSDLLSNTNYYYRVVASDGFGNTFTSDIFTFKTASKPNTAFVNPITFVAVSNNTIVSKSSSSENQNSLVLPVLTNFDFKFALKKNVPVKKAVAILRSANILAASSNSPTHDSETLLIQIQPGIFYGRIAAPSVPGKYQMFVRLTDGSGNITEQAVSDLFVVQAFQVVSKNSNLPIEGARILLYYQNPQTQEFVLLPSTAISILNPSFTNPDGQIDLTLAQGEYKALVSQIGYKDQEVTFTLGTNNGNGYPKVYLERKNIGVADIINYVQRSVDDVFVKSTLSYVESITGSTRLFNIISQFSLLILVLITFFALFRKTHIPLTRFPHYILFYAQKARGTKNSSIFISGFVSDTKNNFLGNAHVYLVNLETEEIISKTISNSSGHFVFRNSIKKSGIIAMKEGYKTSQSVPFEKIDGNEFVIKISKTKNAKEKVSHIPVRLIEGVFSLSFEVLLILSLLFELLSINSFGLRRTAPYLAISLFNLFIWIMYLRIRKHSSS